MAGKKRAKKVTISEMQSYVQALLDFMDEDWTPDKDQWKSLVEMVMNLKEEPTKTVEKIVEVPVQQPMQQHTQHHPHQQPQQRGSAMDSVVEGGNFENRNEINADETTQSRVPMNQRKDFRNINVETIGPSGVKGETGAVSSGKKFKTPDVDTSGGDYESPFS